MNDINLSSGKRQHSVWEHLCGSLTLTSFCFQWWFCIVLWLVWKRSQLVRLKYVLFSQLYLTTYQSFNFQNPHGWVGCLHVVSSFLALQLFSILACFWHLHYSDLTTSCPHKLHHKTSFVVELWCLIIHSLT